jgi:hypothetical protein
MRNAHDDAGDNQIARARAEGGEDGIGGEFHSPKGRRRREKSVRTRRGSARACTTRRSSPASRGRGDLPPAGRDDPPERERLRGRPHAGAAERTSERTPSDIKIPPGATSKARRRAQATRRRRFRR